MQLLPSRPPEDQELKGKDDDNIQTDVIFYRTYCFMYSPGSVITIVSN